MDAVTPAGPIRVVIIDDDALVRAGIALILGGDEGLAVVGEAGDGAQGVSLVRRLDPDVVLMDIRMPTLDGIRATQLLMADAQPPRIIVLTTFDADELIERAVAAGAAGFLLKDTPPARLVAAIHDAAAGLPALSPVAAAHLMATVADSARRTDDQARAEAHRRVSTLTDREREVAAEVGRGRSNAEIAAALFLSLPTVKAHVGHIMTKLGVTNRVQLALLVHDAGDV